MRILMRAAVAVVVWSPVFAASSAPDGAPEKFTPEIRGVVSDHGRPVQSNVCLRQRGSEIRACGYSDFSGRFYIPASDKLRPVRARNGDADLGPDHPRYWLEIGNVQQPKRIGVVDPVGGAAAVLDLDCDLARDADLSDDRPAICQAQPAGAASRVAGVAPRKTRGKAGR